MDNDEKKIWEETKKEYEHIGRLMASGISDGLSESSGVVTEAMDDLTGSLLEREKFYLAEKERLQREYDAREEEKRRREYQIKLQKAKTYQQMQTVQINEQLRLQKKSNEDYLDSLKETLEKEKKLLEQQKGQITRHFNEIAKRATESVGELNEAREKMEEKLSDYGELFHRRTMTFVNSGVNGTPEVFKDFVLDLSAERRQLEEYAAFLEELSAKNEMPKELYNAIRELSVKDALEYKKALFAMKPEELSLYLEDYKAIQVLSKSTAEAVFADDMEQALLGIEKELESWYGSIPQAFFSEGELSAEAFGQAFINKLDSMQAMLQEAVVSVMTHVTLQEKVDNKEARRGTGGVHNSVTYILQSAGETIAEQLRSAQSHAAIERLRGGY